MRTKYFAWFCLTISLFTINAQQPGDTIKIQGFRYGSNTRDTSLMFPASNLNFEKIILKYNMRCKNGLVSNQANPNQGCGEWDYSCNTFIVDSSSIEQEQASTPQYLVSNFSGTTFPIASIVPYNYYIQTHTLVNLAGITSETQYTLGTGAVNLNGILNGSQKSGKLLVFYSAADLQAAGLTAGPIQGLMLFNTGNAGLLNFFKVAIQQTTLSATSPSLIPVSGFTSCFQNHYAFVNGPNRIQFATAFNWNGSSGLWVEFSFTNSTPNTAITLAGSNSSSVQSFYSQNGYAADFSAGGHSTLSLNAANTISNEITIAFWAFGNASYLPANTSIVYGTPANSSDRHLNIHLPWSNSSIYFDCGYSAGNFDRINNAAQPADIAGQWNYWVFTKNAVSGDMSIYLNGVLWFSGTAKTKPIVIQNVLLGKDLQLNNNYKGLIKEFSIWNKALSLSDIQNGMRLSITNQHPQYANLIGYYPLNEGTGLVINEQKNTLSATATNIQWHFERGSKLQSSFTGFTNRPNIRFLRGTYTINTSTVSALDSVIRNPSIVQQFSIQSNATVQPMAHDAIITINTFTLHAAKPRYVYDAETGVVTATLATPSNSNLIIPSLNYIRRFPYYNEIMSFVTPYGKGLDMGIKGKTWLFDVSDFAPLLKGKKRLLMTMGGEYQEQMNLEFWFIVGTAPQPVLQYQQLWQGGARWGGPGISSIINNSRFAPTTLTVHPQAQYVKLRSTITGHGAEGEFHQNGGLITHKLNINGGADEFTWNITELCGDNVVFPQGGTWVYDRQGWCPGKPSKLKEFDATTYCSPGNTLSIDYQCTNPPNPSGDYRFIAAHQLISYGAPSFSLDARILEVRKPNDLVVYSRKNPVCLEPEILIQNSGSTAIQQIVFEYWANASVSKETFTWTGTLNLRDTTSVRLPIGNLWKNAPLTSATNTFQVKILSVNQTIDQYAPNNRYQTTFSIPDRWPNDIIIEVKTNNNPLDNTYELLDASGNLVAGVSPLLLPNNVYRDTFNLDGCYTIRVKDLGGDGLSWWANSGQGTGFVRIKNIQGNLLKAFNSDFGSGFEYQFTTQDLTGIYTKPQYSVLIYPNPSHDFINVQSQDRIVDYVEILDVLGRRVVNQEFNKNAGVIQVKHLPRGTYMVKINAAGESTLHKLILQ